MIYAADTKVDVAKTRAEIERMILAEGGKQFTTSNDEDRGVSMIAFRLQSHGLLFELTLPKREAFAKKKDRWGSPVAVPDAQAYKAWEQACRAKWRALYLTIKAKLVSVAAGVETFEDAFLSAIVVNDGNKATRFGALAVKAIHESYNRAGGLPQLLPGNPK